MSKGLLTVEQVWELPLTATGDRPSLDSLAVELHKLTKDSERISFVEDTVAVDNNSLVAFEIVKHIIAVRKADNALSRPKHLHLVHKDDEHDGVDGVEFAKSACSITQRVIELLCCGGSSRW